MYTHSDRHGYCDTCHHIRAVHGVTGDPRHEPCECCEPTGDTMTNKPQQFRKRPVVIEAVQFSGENRREVLSFIYPNLSEDALFGAEVARLPVVIGTLEGDMTVSPGDWVIRGVQGEFYPCKPDIFADTYEPVVPVPDVTFDNPVTVQGETR